jgi:hypothetical protein
LVKPNSACYDKRSFAFHVFDIIILTMEVIPAINVDSFEEVEKRIKLVEPYTQWVHCRRYIHKKYIVARTEGFAGIENQIKN